MPPFLSWRSIQNSVAQEPFGDQADFRADIIPLQRQRQGRLDKTSLAAATGIAVVNGNVHVSGHEFIDGIVVPTYWLNGVPTRLSNPGVGYWTNGMAVSGNNVYILVRENGSSVQDPDKIGYWKVGKSITELTSGVYHGSVYGIAADGNDVYVVGDYRFDGGPSSACIWKNGEISKLPSGGSDYSEATGIFIAKEPI